MAVVWAKHPKVEKHSSRRTVPQQAHPHAQNQRSGMESLGSTLRADL